MKNNVRMLRRYFRTIRQALPCDRQLKRLILCDIKENVYSYLEENPQAEFSAIEARFGKPETIAAAYISSEETSTLLHSYRIRRRIVTIVAGMAVAMVLIWGIGALAVAVHEITEFPGYIDRTIEHGDPYETPPYYHQG